MNTTLALLALAARNSWYIHQVDFDSAFLNASVKEEIYMRPPNDFCINIPEGHVLRLKKTLYGLKQGAADWFNLLRRKLLDSKFEQSVKDPCMFYKNKEDNLQVILIYVDDVPIFAKTMKEIDDIKDLLKSFFDIKNLGELKYILGVRITRDLTNKKIYLDQEGLIARTAEKYLGKDCKPTFMPYSTSTRLEKYDKECDAHERQQYQALIGSLLYVSRYTRPEIAAIVGVLSRHSSNPGPDHFNATERILRYLLGSKKDKLTLSGKGEFGITVYCDSDWASDTSERKSTSGYATYIGNALVSWGSRKQQCITLSTMEAEYVALAEAAKESLWLKQLLYELGEKEVTPLIFCDNQSTIRISKDAKHHARSKHIDIRHHFLRELIAREEIKLEYVKSERNTADILTKVLPKERFILHKQGLGVNHPPTSGSVKGN